MLTIYDHVENQLDALAIYLLQFEQFYEEDRDPIIGISLPPWRADTDRRAVWMKLAEHLKRYRAEASAWFEELPIKPLRISNSPIEWGEKVHRSYCELLLYASQHRLSNLAGKIAHHHEPNDPDGIWSELKIDTFIGKGWTDLVADEAARELRRAAHGIQPVDIEDQLTETTTFGPFHAWIEDGEILIETEVSDDQQRAINRHGPPQFLPFDVVADEVRRTLKRAGKRLPTETLVPQAWKLAKALFFAGKEGCTATQLRDAVDSDSIPSIRGALTALRVSLAGLDLTVSDARKEADGRYRIVELDAASEH